uniref:Uncharacterized protein n=1 Tax=viral metagenome TaxID=1070528 RepID=A0A6M3IH10_9ZZZZ
MSIMDSYFNHSIDYIYSIARNKYGDKIPTEQYSDIPCRWVEKITQVTNAENEEVLSRIEVWLPAEYDAVKHNWKIVKDSATYFVASKEVRVDLDGEVDHIKLYLV